MLCNSRGLPRGRKALGQTEEVFISVAIGVEEVDAADIGHGIHLGLEHQVDVPARHPPPVILRCRDPVRSHELDQVVLDDSEILDLLVEMTRQQ